MKKALLSKVEELAPELYELSDYICDHPELGFQEQESCRVLTQRLVQSGFQVETGVGDLPTAFRATYENGAGGPSWACCASTTPWRAWATPADTTCRARRRSSAPRR